MKVSYKIFNICFVSSLLRHLVTFFVLFLLGVQVSYAFEDCIISSDGKLTDIKIKDESVIKILPIVTIMNEKNMYIIQPLKEGKTHVCVLKNDKDIIDFDVRVKTDETTVSRVDGIEFLTLDEPEEFIEIDEPPSKLNNPSSSVGEGVRSTGEG